MGPFIRFFPYWLIFVSMWCPGCHSQVQHPENNVSNVNNINNTNNTNNTNNVSNRPMLRKWLEFDLDQVASFVVVSQSALKSWGSGFPPVIGRNYKDGEPSHLYAITLTGEALVVSLVEGTEGTTEGLSEPVIREIFPTVGWIFFSTDNYRVWLPQEEGDPLEVRCGTIAARRADGALFCADLGITSHFGTGIPWRKSVLSDAVGDLVYVMSIDAFDRRILYRLDMTGDQGPTGTRVSDLVEVEMFQVNAEGALLVTHMPQVVGPDEAVTQFFRADGSDGGPLTMLGGVFGSFYVAGEVGAADENAFYLIDGNSEFGYFPTTLRVLTPTAEALAEEVHELAQMPDVGGCMCLHRLFSGIHMICGLRLVRLVEDATVLDVPVELPITGADRFLDINGLPMRLAPGFIVLHTGEGDTHKLVRHDGYLQEDIPLDPQVDLDEVIVSADGGLEIWGMNLDTQKRVIGTVAPGSTEVTLFSVEGIDAQQVVTFTRIN